MATNEEGVLRNYYCPVADIIEHIENNRQPEHAQFLNQALTR